MHSSEKILPGYFPRTGTRPALSPAYLMVVYHQQPNALTHGYQPTQTYLLFCARHQLSLNRLSVNAFVAGQTGQHRSKLIRFLEVYERIGRPVLLTPEAVWQVPYLGPYRVEELIRFWTWQHGRSEVSLPTRAVSQALEGWMDYLRRSRQQGALDTGMVGDYLHWLRASGVSEPLICQRVVAIRRWAGWLLSQKVVLRFEPAAQVPLRTIQQAQTGRAGWYLESQMNRDEQTRTGYEHRIGTAAPLIRHLLKKGLPLAQLPAIRLSQICLNYIEYPTIQLGDAPAWRLRPEGATLLQNYLRHTDRWYWLRDLPDQRLFEQPDWETLWASTRLFLRSLRVERRRRKRVRVSTPPKVDLSSLWASLSRQ